MGWRVTGWGASRVRLWGRGGWYVRRWCVRGIARHNRACVARASATEAAPRPTHEPLARAGPSLPGVNELDLQAARPLDGVVQPPALDKSRRGRGGAQRWGWVSRGLGVLKAATPRRARKTRQFFSYPARQPHATGQQRLPPPGCARIRRRRVWSRRRHRPHEQPSLRGVARHPAGRVCEVLT